MISATVFDIERYAVEDGPGIRTVVFFKGCNLRCSWCQNPESHLGKAQVMYYQNRCNACRKCLETCPEGAIREIAPLGFITDSSTCTLCGACVDACFRDARRIVGRTMTVQEIMDQITKDRDFYRNSGGGVTFSGGEPLLQPDVVSELATRCRAEGIHTALETAGHVRPEVFDRVVPDIDLLYFDLKHIDSDVHQRVTGVPLGLILDNFRRVAPASEDATSRRLRIVARIPVVPGVNADMPTVSAMAQFLVSETSVREVELLPFHRLGGGKYTGLGQTYEFESTENLSSEDCEPLAAEGRRLGLDVRIGAEGA